MKIQSFLLFIFFIISAGAQQSTYNFDPYSVVVKGTTLEISKNDILIHSKNFQNPLPYSVDLDGDNMSELLITDHYNSKGRELFTLYIYNTIDSFFLADSIFSGYIDPYFTFSEEINDLILITGNPDFVQFDYSGGMFLPINCYKFDSGEVLNINDEVYDIFIEENNELLDFIEGYFTTNAKDCSGSKNIISAIASVYANYINAGETTLANHLISNYYYCDDDISFMKKMNELILN